MEDKPAKPVEERSAKPVPIPKQPWLLLCALMSGLCALGIRWLLLPRTLRRWQMKSQREAEAALAKEAREKANCCDRAIGLRQSFRSREVRRKTAQRCSGGCSTKSAAWISMLQTMNATIRAGGRFTPVLTPERKLRGEVLVLIDDEGKDYPWLSTVLALVELWKRQGVRLSRLHVRKPISALPGSVSTHAAREQRAVDVAREH